MSQFCFICWRRSGEKVAGGEGGFRLCGEVGDWSQTLTVLRWFCASLFSTWCGTPPCPSWATTTTSSSPHIFWTSPWASRPSAPSCPPSHTMANRWGVKGGREGAADCWLSSRGHRTLCSCSQNLRVVYEFINSHWWWFQTKLFTLSTIFGNGKSTQNDQGLITLPLCCHLLGLPVQWPIYTVQ